MEKASTRVSTTSSPDQQASHETRCFELLSTVIDGEASPEEVDFFNTHSRECLPLYRLYQLDVAIKQVLARRMEKKCVPAGLIDVIKSRIKEIRL